MSIADKISRLSDARDAIISALAGKGVTAIGHGFEDFATDIGNIQTGGGGTPNLQTKSKTYTPTESQQTENITADSGYDGLDEVNVTVNAVSSSYVGSGITRRYAYDLLVNGKTVTVPAGYYASASATNVVAGTAGTPVATKSGVNNHSVDVIPSVTNVTGYINGGTITGTPVSVHASDLVSGSETKNANGTYDVTNLAELVVAVPTPKNIQCYMGRDYGNANGYVATNVSLTVAKTGTYNVSWTGWRSSPQGTMGSRLRVNSTDGTDQTAFTSDGQCITLTNQSYTAGDVLTVYANSGSSAKYMFVSNLIIEEQ